MLSVDKGIAMNSHYIKLGQALILFAGISVFTSCSKDTPEEDWCIRDGYRATVHVVLSADESMYDYQTVTVSDPEAETRAGEKWRLRYSLCAYNLEEGGDASPIFNISSLSPELDVSLPLGKYRLVGWADYVPEETEKSKYFHIDDFSDMLLIDKFSYSGSDPHKMAFLGQSDCTVSYRTPEIDIDLSPAMGQYRIIATDSPDYEVGKVVISYPKGMPASMDARSGKICYNWMGVSFVSNPGECLVYDNLFAEETGKNVKVRLEIYDKSGNLKACRKALDVPLIRGGITLVKANCYTILECDNTPGEGSGGIGIDDSYGDTHVIVI